MAIERDYYLNPRRLARLERAAAEWRCLTCGGERLEGVELKARYCDEDCLKSARAERRRRRPRATRVAECKRCAGVIPADRGRNSRYCSAECQRLRNAETKVCADCGADFVARADSIFCEPCRREFFPKGAHVRYSTNAQRVIRHGGEVERGISVRRIARRDGWSCGVCGSRIDESLVYPDPRSVSIDHVKPISAGGDDVMANVQIAHLECNLDKAAAESNQDHWSHFLAFAEDEIT